VATLLILMAGVAHAQRPVRLKVATLAPEGTFWMEEARRASDEISRRTDGRVALRLYPGGTMGSDDMVLRKMRIGQLHGGAVLTGSLSRLDPDVELYNLPLLFRSYDEVDHVRRRMDHRLIGELVDDGLVSFGLIETGFVYLMSSKAIRTFAELEGRKAWVPENDPIGKAIVDALGLAPVPLSISDVLTGLQTGLVDTVAAPPVGAVALQWFTKTPFVTDLPITYVYGSFVLTERALEQIGDVDRVVVREVLVGLASELDRRTRTDNEQAREALQRQGVTFVTPTPETEARWEEVAAEATELLIERQDYDREILAELRRLLEEYRARQRMADAAR
jgi:TRAP-type C4-dicarboxylate transport system substrate-binding protein